MDNNIYFFRGNYPNRELFGESKISGGNYSEWDIFLSSSGKEKYFNAIYYKINSISEIKIEIISS